MKSNLPILFLASALFVTGCSSTKSPEEQAKIANQQNQNFNKAQSAIDGLAARIQQAKEDRIPYFAPKLLVKAQKNLAEAKDEFNDFLADITDATNSATKDILQEIAEGNASLDQANNIKRNAESILSENFEIIGVLTELKVNQYKSEARLFKRLKQDVDELVEDIADGDLDDARKDNAKLLPKLRQLEVTVMKKVYLTEVQNQIAVLKKARANSKQPVTYKAAVSAVNNASAVIASNPRDKAAIEEAVTKAQFSIDRAQKMKTAILNLSKVSSKQRENYLLQFENLFQDITIASGGSDFRNLSFPEQSKAIAAEIVSLKQASTDAAAQLAQSQQNAESLASANSNQLAAIQTEKDALQEMIKTKDSELEAKTGELTTALTDLSAAQLKLTEVTQQLSQLQLELAEKEQALATLQQQSAPTEDAQVETESSAESNEAEAADNTSEQSN